VTDIAEDIPPGSWLPSVAEVLPLAHRAPMPFTLGEAVEEYRLWAAQARRQSWDAVINRSSLDLDLSQLAGDVGPRLGALLRPHLDALLVAPRDLIPDVANAFTAAWRSSAGISAAFRDLCEAANGGGVTSVKLRRTAEILASQLGPSAQGGWGVLHETASALTDDPNDFAHRRRNGTGAIQGELSDADRLRLAEDVITTKPPTGETVVWIVYRRAISTWKVEAGPITFLRADWFVPNARRGDGQDFPGREELRYVLENSWWAKDLDAALEDSTNRLVIARVALGERAAAGAVETAQRMVDAVLSIAVRAGGVSWQPTGSFATTVDGRLATSSVGLDLGRRRRSDDTYGMGATSTILQDVTTKLGKALSDRPMPEFLVEAIIALREASMTDHRDVGFYGTRAVTPRIATAMEDHAMELIASFAEMSPNDLAAALEQQEIDWQFEQRVLGAMMAPFDTPPEPETEAHRAILENAISKFDDSGRRIVSIHDAVNLRSELSKLPMTDLMRSDLVHAVEAVTSAEAEAALRQSIADDVGMIRRRHRRVRNAVNHGNPLSTAALESIRGYADRASQMAIGFALESYASGTSLSSILEAQSTWNAEQANGRNEGRNFVQRNAPALPL
jgi:hypothetical protein